MFANNFKTPMGTWCVYGLFSAGIFAYASQHPILVESIPYFEVLKYAAFSGRGIASFAELWMCQGYLSLVIERDTEAGTKRSK
jgi:hypothetical protein